MKDAMQTMYALKAISKGFSVYLFVLLPVFFAQGVIDGVQVGYIGAVSIAAMVCGAYSVAHWLHRYETRSLLFATITSLSLLTLVLVISGYTGQTALMTVSYALSGFSIGVMGSAVDTVIAGLTEKGNRYTSIAKLTVLGDIIRIILPVAIAAALSIGNIIASYILVIIAAGLFLNASLKVPRNLHTTTPNLKQNEHVLHNKAFRYFLRVEFLDSFASTQLFVFLPILFLAKGYSVENSLLLQTSIFFGYMSGRLIVSYLANRVSGQKAVAYAEIGMALSIMLLLAVSNIVLLYTFSFLLGLFTRGTSPAIKALTFDSLKEHQVKRGVAFYIMAGDSGSAIAQLAFGVLIAWLRVNAPFVVAAVIACFVALILLIRPARL